MKAWTISHLRDVKFDGHRVISGWTPMRQLFAVQKILKRIDDLESAWFVVHDTSTVLADLSRAISAYPTPTTRRIP